MIGLLLITHNQIGQEYITWLQQTFTNKALPPCQALSIAPDTDPDVAIAAGKKLLAEFPSQHNLILSDCIGATPSNIAHKIAYQSEAGFISGLNAAMLMRAINYNNLPFPEFINKVYEGGKSGIYKEYQAVKHSEPS